MNCYKNDVTALVWIFVFVGTMLILMVFTGDHSAFSGKMTYSWAADKYRKNK
jgi:hypothetical protein